MIASDAIFSTRAMSVTLGRREVLRDVTMLVRRGQFVSLIGGSGAGKSTLLNALAGLIGCSGDVQRPPAVSVVFQNYALFPWLTVRKNIAFGIRGLPKSEVRRRVEECLERIGLASHAERYPAELSGGQTQRVAFARSLAARPDAILMDEPFGALDDLTRFEMESWLLEEWAATRTTILCVTHNIDQALFLSDSICLIADRTLAGTIPVDLPRPRVPSVRYAPEFAALKQRLIEIMQVHQRTTNGPRTEVARP